MKKIIIASLDVDPQKGFTKECPNELPIKEGHMIVSGLFDNHSKADYKIVSRDLHPQVAHWNAETPSNMFEKVGLENVDIKWNPHCVHGTKGSELIDGLPHPIMGYDFSIVKGTEPDMHPYGACFHDLKDTITTGIIEFLNQKDVDVVIVGGLATDYCVLTTVKQLLGAGLTVVLNLNSVRGVAEDTTEEAIKLMRSLDNCIVVDDIKNFNIGKLIL
jgi:nicotinamidase/pyrazinamidase